MPGIRAVGLNSAAPTRLVRHRIRPPTMASNNRNDENGCAVENGKTSPSSPTTKTSKLVNVKIEVIDEEEDNDVEVNAGLCENDDSDTKSYALPFDAKEERDLAKVLPRSQDGAIDGRRTTTTRDNLDLLDEVDDLHSLAADHDDAISDDLNNHDRYSPFEGMCENSENDDFSPIHDQTGNVVLEVDCGTNSALLYVNKLCQGSKGQCILFEDRWYTPNEFQFISGRETAKDWKRSIRHRGKSLKILMGRGLLRAHPLMCECDTCRLNFVSKGGLRIGDRRVAVSSSTSNGAMPITERSRLRRTAGPDGEGAHLNDIIDQLQHGSNGSNGYMNGGNNHLAHHHSYEGSRKRSHAGNASPTSNSSPSPLSSSVPCGLALIKRPRSISPREDDIYDEQQRKIFEAANSPEPQNIENLRRSLNLSTSRSSSPSGDRLSPAHTNGSHPSFYAAGTNGGPRGAPMVAVAASTLSANGSAGPADLSRNSSTSSSSLSPPSGASVGSSGVVLMTQPPQMMVKQQTKSRKQTAPQHLDVGNHGDEAHPHRSAHIVLSSYANQQYSKANAAIRPRYQSTPAYNQRSSHNNNGGSTVHHSTGSSGELNLSTNGSASSSSSRRATHAAVKAACGPVKMIALARPEIVASSTSGYSSGSRPSSAHSSSNPGEDGRPHTPVHSSSGNNDAVFLSADMASWSVSDVTHFVRSLKGCEEYGPVFLDQAIDGEILPVLTEDHLLHNMGLKLGPALKIRLHVARRLGFTLDGQYCIAGGPVPAPPVPAASQPQQQQTAPLPTAPRPQTPSAPVATQQQPTPAVSPSIGSGAPASAAPSVEAAATASVPSTPSSATQKSGGDVFADDAQS